MLPSDMRARVLRSALDTMSDEIRDAGLAPALAARLAVMASEVRRHAMELEETLRPLAVASMPSRRFVGHSEPGSNVVTLRAG